jgi:TM2 domain-containing membrane protein YozV
MKNKTTAALLAFFLGGLGAHKFYLGEIALGILYLAFCWTLIPGIIAFFEFIIYLAMSDQSFNAKYNKGFSSSGTYVSMPSQEIGQDSTDTLNEIKRLYESGEITAEEYEERRRKLIDSL